MTNRMNAILERVLSEELAKQEVWSKEDVELFGKHMNRDGIIQEIKNFMKEENIKFREDFYNKQLEEM